jgi:ferritin-like metal-binding protein YciE
MKAVRSTRSQGEFEKDEFENALMAELEELRKSEKALQKMYPRLKTKPQLRTTFLRQLADMQHRAHRLDAVLNPVGAVQYAWPVRLAAQSSVA